MFAELLNSLLSHVMFITLHLNVSSSFPPPLSSQDEKKYLREMKKGDEKAKKKLIEHNLRLVAHVIKKY